MMKMNNDVALNVLNNISEHIIYDPGLKEICYSAQFVKTINYIKNKIKEGEMSE